MKRNIELEYIKCNLCGSNDYNVIYKAKYAGKPSQSVVEKFKSSGDETLIDQVVKCKKCGLIYINPRIQSNLILKGYSEGMDKTFVSQAKGRELTFSKCLNLIHKYHKTKDRILDVGTAGGSFLAVAKKRGWEVYGCEPNKWLCDWCKKNYGIKIEQGDIFKQKYKSKFFDVVTLWDVLEHTPDPTAVLKECNRVLKPGGLLIVNYPDIGSWIAKLMKSKWVFLLSVHLFYFTPKTITKMLNKTGYNIIKRKPHFQSLEIGYLIFRMKAYSKLLHKLGAIFIKLVGLKGLQFPYWLGQTLIIAEKNGNKK